MKTSLVTAHAPLKGEQRLASDPGEHVWLSASAGTGKTYVLSARVLRLLLRGARPDSILCLTFTKAGAAEMAERVHQRLAWWVRLDDTVLFRELEALGEACGPAERENARTLFAKVLESRGGGLRIMTIHAFCQTLLAGFPLEAGLIPGFRPIEGREEAALGQSVLADVVVTAEREGDRRLLGDLSALSRRLGEDEARRFLSRAARAGEALDALPEGLDALVRRAMDVPAEFDAGDIALACSDGAFDRPALLELARMYAGWATKTGEAAADRIAEWLLGSPEQRAAELPLLALIWLNKDGEFRKNGPKDSGFPALRERLNGWCGELCGLAARAELAAGVSSALNAGRRYARAYDGAKRARGLVDFDDLIRLTVGLLAQDGVGDWIRYKLDQATDHILVDEAQDTNLRQWRIVAGLASEFFAGDGARDNFERTIFTVGDFKQAIFGFQGTDPEHYGAARIGFNRQAEDAGREIVQLSLNASFRSSQPILDVVDKLLDELGHAALGLPEASEPHVSAGGGFGAVTLLQPLTGDSATEDGVVEDVGEEGWVEDHVRKLAGALAKQVRGWLGLGGSASSRVATPRGRHPELVSGSMPPSESVLPDDGWILKRVQDDGSGGGAPAEAAPSERVWLERKQRWLRPEDVMILVRKRGELAALLVARLQAEGVPVAGVDRLRLQAPLAVKDLLAAMRFAVQRGDDLTLAALLVSPLMGWDQDQLYAVAHGRKGSLWDAVPECDTRAELLTILNSADRVTPFQFLEILLSGPLQGRRKLIARLGEEARDPIDELLNAALQFGREGTASLQGFLDWFDRGEGEIVRDAMGAGDAVRVMTVHGAKGLQAPVVVLADAAGDPDASGARGFEWLLDTFDAPDGSNMPVPLFRPRAAERALVASLEEAADRADASDRREHWRLLYVAMTRAEERLVVTGSLGTRAKGVVPAESWHAAIGRALARLEVVGVADPVWGSRADYVVGAIGARIEERVSAGAGAGLALPDWLRVAAPVEARPPRPLAPSSLGVDMVASPPGVAGKADAAERGRRLHGLFERLPGVAAEKRRVAGIGWLADPELVDAALAVIDDPAFADVFAEGALAEAPIAGVVDGVVVSGVVDRLIVTDTSVTIVDFKTGRVPREASAVPVHHLRQMAAYAAVVTQIFPGRAVGAALLYSAGPVLHRLSVADLERWKPGFSDAIENLGVAG